MTLILTNEDAAQVLTMRDVLERLELLYHDLGNGSAVYRGRTDLFAPTSAHIDEPVPAAHQFKTLDGAIPRWEVASIRVTSDIVAFPIVNGARRRIKVPAAANRTYVGLVFLFSSATGELIAVLQDGMLQKFCSRRCQCRRGEISVARKRKIGGIDRRWQSSRASTGRP